MLGKLIKYEFKACGRTFFPIYIGILVLAVINGIFNNYNVFNIEDETSLNFSIVDIKGIFILVLFALFVALFVITIILTIQRFKRCLLEDEGYLMFTLPVSIKNLILSKYLVSLIFIALSTLVAIATFLIIGLFSGVMKFSDLMNIFRLDILSMYASTEDFWKFLLFLIYYLVLMYSIFIFTIYLSVSIGQFSKFNKHRAAAGIITFFGINMILSYLQSFAYKLLNLNNVVYDIVPECISSSITVIFSRDDIIMIILSTLMAVLLFIGTDWILSKKLNLE